MSAEYELILMLDPEVPDERREEIAANARGLIESGGTLRHSDSWGMRKLAYEIGQRTEADYRFFRFEVEPPVLADLDHTLKITDGILRFRVFKVDPRSPLIEPPAPSALAAPKRRDDRGGRGRGDGRRDSLQEQDVDAEPAAAEEPATEAPDAAESEEPATEAPEAGEAEVPAEAEAPSEPVGEGESEPAEPAATER